MKRRNDRVEVTEDGAIYEVLPEVKDEFAPTHVVLYKLKRRDCCHAVKSEPFTHKARQFLTNKESTITFPTMACPFDDNKPRMDDGECPSNHAGKGACPHFRRKL